MARARRMRGYVFQRRRQGAGGGGTGDIWYIRIRLADGREIKRAIGPSQAAAEEALAAALTAAAREQYLGVKAIASVTFAQLRKLADASLRSTQSPVTRTRARFRYELIAEWFGTQTVDTVTVGDVERFVTALKEEREVAGSTVNRYLAALSRLYRFALSEGYARTNPVKGVQRQRENSREVRLLTALEFEQLQHAALPALRPIIAIAFDGGLRRGEIAALQWTDVVGQGAARELIVRRSKSGKSRRVPCLPRVCAVLDALSAARGPRPMQGPDPLFPHYHGDGVERISWDFRKAVKRAQLLGVCFHDLRHNFAVGLVEAGVPITHVNKLLGHAPGSITTTMRYVDHYRESAGKVAMQKLSVWRGQAPPSRPALEG